MIPEMKKCRFCGHPILTFKDEYIGYPPDNRVYLDGCGSNEQIFSCPECDENLMYSMLDNY